MIKAFIIFSALLSGEAKEIVINTSESTIIWSGSNVTGKTHMGTLVFKGGSLDIQKGKLKGGSFTIDMATLTNSDLSGEWKAKLEGHLKSDDFFGVETYPVASFVVTEAKSTGGNKYDVTGNIAIKGTIESIRFPAELNENGGNYEATARITVDRTKFDVRYGSDSFFDNLGDKAIRDNFTLEIKLVAAK